MFVIRERLYAHSIYWVSTTIGTTTCFGHVDTDRTITSKVKKVKEVQWMDTVICVKIVKNCKNNAISS